MFRVQEGSHQSPVDSPRVAPSSPPPPQLHHPRHPNSGVGASAVRGPGAERVLPGRAGEGQGQAPYPHKRGALGTPFPSFPPCCPPKTPLCPDNTPQVPLTVGHSEGSWGRLSGQARGRDNASPVHEVTVVSPCPPRTGPSQLPETHSYHHPPADSPQNMPTPKRVSPHDAGSGVVSGALSLSHGHYPPSP